MGVMASWRSMRWETSTKKIRAFSSLTTSAKLKKVTDEETGEHKMRGLELRPLSLSYEVSGVAGVDPRGEFEAWGKQVGKSGAFYLGGRRFGPRSFELDQVQFTVTRLNDLGEVLVGTISLSFTEKSSESSSDRAPEEKLQIIYQGVDIYDDISVNQCYHDMFAASRSDELVIRFNDTNRMWDGWSPQNNDTIEIVDGAARTGKMFIESVNPQNGMMELLAYSIPPSAKNKTNKSWEQVKKSQIFQEVAGRHSLGFEMYGVEDQQYDYVAQQDMEDFVFLEFRCSLEGDAFLVYDGVLVLYNEAALESEAPAKTVEIDTDKDYEYNDDSLQAYGSAEVVNGGMTGTFDSGSGNDKTFSKILQLVMSSQAEANRFAKGLLWYNNKDAVIGTWSTSLLRDVAAGSVLEIQTAGAQSWDGPAFLFHVRHDYVGEKTKLFFRKPLEGY